MDRQDGREENTAHSKLPQALDVLFLSVEWVDLISLMVLTLFSSADLLTPPQRPLSDPWCERRDIKVGTHRKAVDILVHLPQTSYCQR